MRNFHNNKLWFQRLYLNILSDGKDQVHIGRFNLTVISWLDCRNVLYMGLPLKSIQKIQLVQSAGSFWGLKNGPCFQVQFIARVQTTWSCGTCCPSILVGGVQENGTTCPPEYGWLQPSWPSVRPCSAKLAWGCDNKGGWSINWSISHLLPSCSRPLHL